MSLGQHHTLDRPRLLVSVRDAVEARTARAGGADWIDLKEPSRGSLGAVDAAVAQAVADELGEGIPLSAAAGELVDWQSPSGRQLQTVGRVEYLKLGLSSCCKSDWRSQWAAVEREVLAAGKLLVNVAYVDVDAADAPPIAEVLSCAAESRSRWLVLDTFDKSCGRLGDFLARDELLAVLDAAGAAGVRIAVAGRLDAASIAALPLERIDLIAVRGAACGGSRLASVNSAAVAALAGILHKSAAHRTYDGLGAAKSPSRKNFLTRAADPPY